MESAGRNRWRGLHRFPFWRWFRQETGSSRNYKPGYRTILSSGVRPEGDQFANGGWRGGRLAARNHIAYRAADRASGRMMNAFRHYLAVTITVFMPAVLLYWFLLHPFVRFWRRLGPTVSLGILWSVVFGAAAGLFLIRDQLLGADYGTHAVLVCAGVVCLGVAGWLRHKLGRHFTARTLVGLQELAPAQSPQELVTDGLHARVRHPRYLQLLLALLGWALLANHLGAYLVFGLWIPGVCIIVLLEERELRERFGAEYRDYCRRVPRFIPWSRSDPASVRHNHPTSR